MQIGVLCDMDSSSPFSPFWDRVCSLHMIEYMCHQRGIWKFRAALTCVLRRGFEEREDNCTGVKRWSGGAKIEISSTLS